METTQEQYEMFAENFRYWACEFFRLGDWNVDIIHDNPPTDDGSKPLGFIVASLEDRYARVFFAAEAPEELHTDREVMQHAFHEACELLTMEITVLSEMREGFTKERMTGAVHGLIQRLTNSVWETAWEEYQLQKELNDAEDNRECNEGERNGTVRAQVVSPPNGNNNRGDQRGYD